MSPTPLYPIGSAWAGTGTSTLWQAGIVQDTNAASTTDEYFFYEMIDANHQNPPCKLNDIGCGDTVSEEMDSPNSYYLLDVTTNMVTSGYDIVDAPLVGSQDSVEWISECAPSLVATYQFNQATWTNFNVFGWDASNTFLFSASPGSWGRTVPAQEDCPNDDYFGHGIIATPNDGTVAHDSSGVPVRYTQRR